ncbi:hypothetical protein [Magnetovibrio blakemorei]|uniref:Lysozyme inhibitor LprI N-terminal domain-containing protein n=1 Tax=Magnetovibrio blakemorei TaxID=28181 RepID=A0A1E5Q5I5_9PROT|nr:hypothetical protein [Magnetovibrio blakemorei]OEJ65629.1 hypothetical protein BEN30_13785 [Magnetovibrio blakemorei]
MITRNMMAFIFACAILVWGTIPATAGGNAKTTPKVDIPNAEELIKHCWDISKEKRAEIYEKSWREGHLDTALCLEQAIIDNASILIYEGFYSREKIESEIRLVGKTYGNFYSAMYNENKACSPSCGTIRHTWHISKISKLYESILEDIIALRVEHGL